MARPNVTHGDSLQRTARDLEELDEIAEELQEQGVPRLVELAQRLHEVSQSLKRHFPPEEALMTTGEAMQALGVRSVNTIKKWAREGLLDGYARGSRILVTRESVTRMLASPTVAQQRDYERRLSDALAPFDLGDEHLGLPTNWIGRKPWESNAEHPAPSGGPA
jgi:hypothetical protein